MNVSLKKFWLSLVMSGALLVAGCGDVSTPTATTDPNNPTNPTDPTPTPGAVAYTMTLSSDLTTVPAGGTAVVTATILANGAPDLTLSPAVKFTSTCVASGKASLDASVTGAAGMAVSNYADKGCAGPDTIVATTTIDGQNVSKTLAITVQALTITLTAPATLTAGGSTPVSVNVYSGGALLTTQSVPVTFASSCTAMNTATLSSSVFSINGVATATYTDKGCGIIDNITATATVGGVSASAMVQMTVGKLEVQLTAPTTLVAGTSATITAKVLSGGSAYTASQIPVSFASTCVAANKGTMTSVVLTNATTGVATVTLTDNGCGIATDTLTATATAGSVTASTQAQFLVTGFTMTVVPAINPLAGGASTLVTATVSNDNGPYTQSSQVAFTSNCVGQGTASMTTPAFTSSGVAKSTYTDKGCAGDDVIQATATVGAATVVATAPITVQAVAMTLTTATPTGTSLAAGGTTAVTATVTSGGVAYATPVVVNFTSTCASASKATIASSAFTDAATGAATVDFTDNGCGPTTEALTATALVGGVTLTAGTNLSIKPFTMTLLPDPVLIPNPAVDVLSAGATIPITASIYSDTGVLYTKPVPVAFTSTCVAQAKATMDATVYASNGTSVSSYSDKGCGAITDSLTATATIGGATITANTPLKIASDTAGSISFVSATPANIGIKGAGLTEASLVKFQVVSGTGMPVSGQLVSFSLDNTQGGISFLPASASSDANGYVSTTVTSGTAATTVRVKATAVTPSATLQTLSDGLVISTGISDQDSFSIGLSEFNPEAGQILGTKVSVTVYAADAFNNPVPDGSAIYFTAEGGQIQPSCLTAGGGCTVEWTSADPTPADGRVTILATMVGEESFADANGNNYHDTDELLADMDVPEAWLDRNENGILDGIEEYRDFNSNGLYDAADGLYSGVLCISDCAASKSVEVRNSAYLMMSDSFFTFTFGDWDVDTEVWTDGSNTYDVAAGPTTGYVKICGNEHGGVPPNGTKISVDASNGKVKLVGDTVPNYIPPPPIPPDPLDPDTFPEQCYIQAFTVESDGTPSTGMVTFKATTPSSAESGISMTVTD